MPELVGKDLMMRDLLEERRKLEQQIRELEVELVKVNSDIDQACSHKDVKTIVDYITGGYLNVAEQHTIHSCQICRKELFRTIKYGSFA